MPLLSLKVTSAASVAGTQIGSATVKSAKVVVPSTIGLVINAVGTQGPPGVGATWRGIWSSGTTYAVGDGVTASDAHNYVSLTAGNLAHNPVGDLGVHWSDLLPSSVVLVGSPDTGTSAGARMAVAHEAPLNPLWPEYGVLMDGASDDTTAWGLLITAITGVKGAEIYIPPGGTSIISQLTFPINSTDLVIRGGGSRNQNAASCRLLSHYAGAGAVLTINAAAGLQFKGVGITNDNASFTGKLLNLSRGAGTQDTTQCEVSDLRLQAVAQAGSSVRLLQLTDATITELTRVYCYGGKYAVEGLTAVSDYCNSVTIGAGCLFSQQDTAAIHNLGIDCRIIHATFEPLRSGAAGMYLQDAAIPAGVILIEAPWTGDVTSGGTWIVFNGTRLDVVRGTLDGGAIGVQLNGTTRALVLATHFSGNTTAIDLNGQTVGVFDPRGSSFADSMTTQVTAAAAGVGQGGGGYYAALDAAQVVTNATHALVNATATAVPFDVANYQTSKANWAIGTPTQLVARIPGLHRIYSTVVFDASAVGERAVWFKLNGTTFLPGTKMLADSAGNTKTVVQAVTSRFLNVGDFVECFALQSSGGALNVLVSDSTTGIPTTFGMELA